MSASTAAPAPSPPADALVEIVVDGTALRVRVGQTIAAALLNNGHTIFRDTRSNGDARGAYCAMGVCFECIVSVDGIVDRACMREVRQGMRIERLRRFERRRKT